MQTRSGQKVVEGMLSVISSPRLCVGLLIFQLVEISERGSPLGWLGHMCCDGETPFGV